MTSKGVGVGWSGVGGEASTDADLVFEALAADLEEGRGDPEAVFAAHPDLEAELRTLHEGWLAADALLRDLASQDSMVRTLRCELATGDDDAHMRAVLERLARADFVERYECGQELGRGGMGVVRRAIDRRLGREVAMKVIRPLAPGQGARLLRRFLEEAEVVARLEHPGIVSIHELGIDAEGRVYFTMPLVRGRTLQGILRSLHRGNDGWTRARVLDVLLRVCDAVAYAHSRGVLHRDLKPANVMVGQFGEVYVMDWGLARALSATDDGDGECAARGRDAAMTLQGEVLGTPAYMAPEQAAAGSETLDARCDVYALGAILYEALAGVRPYGECSSAEALDRLRRAPPVAIESLAARSPDELIAIVGRAMARDRSARYSSVAAFSADVRAFVEGRVVGAHRTGALVEAKKWVARNRRLSGALALAGAALVVGLVTSLIFLQAARRERANVFRLAQARTLASLTERADGLWPAHPDRIDAMRAWQDEARSLVRALEPDPYSGDHGLRGQLTQLAAHAGASTDDDRWWHGELEKLVAGIEELADSKRGLLGDGLGPHGFGMGARLAMAERVRSICAAAGVRERWAEVCASVRADPRFGGLELRPQVGLVPVGNDPDSGLWEFAHVLSGEVPARDRTGKLVLVDDSALVLVLLPPGEFWMGSQIDDPARPNFAYQMPKQEYPAHRRSLGAFFMAKHEMTQAQWQRCTGTNPSYFAREPQASRLPVETISWPIARRELLRAGLRLPAEVEWEYACRAGSTTEYFWGEDPLAVATFGNVKDEDAIRFRPELDSTAMSPTGVPSGARKDYLVSTDRVPVQDGFRELAPVGSFRANAFGLHDMIGNVWEWCEDVLGLYPGARGTPFEAELPARELRVLRGGAFNRTTMRSAERGREGPAFAYQGVGVRPARALDP